MGLFKKKKIEYVPKQGILGNAVDYSVYNMKLIEKIIYFIIGAVVGGIIGYLFYESKFLSITVGLICGINFVPSRRKQIIAKRKKKLLLEFRDALESLATSIGAGNNVPDSFLSAEKDMSSQYSTDSYIVQELGIINKGIYNNIAVEALLLDFGDRSELDDITIFANVFETCYRKGGDTKEVIKNTHQIISDKIDISMEIQTVVTSKKGELNAMLVMPVIFVIMLKAMGKEVVDLTSFVGMVSTTIAVVLFVVSYLIGKKVLNIKV